MLGDIAVGDVVEALVGPVVDYSFATAFGRYILWVSACPSRLRSSPQRSPSHPSRLRSSTSLVAETKLARASQSAAGRSTLIRGPDRAMAGARVVMWTPSARNARMCRYIHACGAFHEHSLLGLYFRLICYNVASVEPHELLYESW